MSPSDRAMVTTSRPSSTPERTENNRMDSSNPHQPTQRTSADATVEIWTGWAGRPARHEQERPKWFLGVYLPPRPIRAPAQEVNITPTLIRLHNTRVRQAANV